MVTAMVIYFKIFLFFIINRKSDNDMSLLHQQVDMEVIDEDGVTTGKSGIREE